MSPNRPGLKFDFFERIHLSELDLGIKELTNMELIPEMKMLADGGQALLRGHLILKTDYVIENEYPREAHFTHKIPVEITLPMNRIRNIQDVEVDVDNFDIEVISPRSFNVTGVLSIEGIDATPEPEEFIFSHRVEEELIAPLEVEIAPQENLAEEQLPEQKGAVQVEDQTLEQQVVVPVEELIPEQQVAVQVVSNAESNDPLKWKKLFLDRSNEPPRFRKVRMCIARKEDTLEIIADRYKKSTHELMTYNQMNEPYLHVGQIVYIP